MAQINQRAWIQPGKNPRIVKRLKQKEEKIFHESSPFAYIFKKKCVVHPTLIKAATGGKKMARIVNKLEEGVDRNDENSDETYRLPTRSPMMNR